MAKNVQEPNSLGVKKRGGPLMENLWYSSKNQGLKGQVKNNEAKVWQNGHEG